MNRERILLEGVPIWVLILVILIGIIILPYTVLTGLIKLLKGGEKI